MTDVTYAGYIRTGELLGLQEPRSGPDDPLTRASEHFFIVAHQTSELWLAQALLDLDEAHRAVGRRQYADAAECLQRCAVVLDVMTANLDVLATMPPGRFACFRGELGRASGAQSSQFHQLDRWLGLTRSGESPLVEAVVTACQRERTTLAGLLRPGAPDVPDLARVALAMLDVSRKSWRWKVVHVELVSRMIGQREPGTGGSSGAHWLAGRLTMPFGVLWAAVSAMHEDVRGDRVDIPS